MKYNLIKTNNIYYITNENNDILYSTDVNSGLPSIDTTLVDGKLDNFENTYLPIELEMTEGSTVISGGFRSMDDIGGKGLTHHTTYKPRLINNKVKIISFTI